jgi:hypothetical protein
MTWYPILVVLWVLNVVLMLIERLAELSPYTLPAKFKRVQFTLFVLNLVTGLLQAFALYLW